MGHPLTLVALIFVLQLAGFGQAKQDVDLIVTQRHCGDHGRDASDLSGWKRCGARGFDCGGGS